MLSANEKEETYASNDNRMFFLSYSIFQELNNNSPPGKGVLNKVYTGRLLPEVQPFTLVIFDRNGTPSVYLLLINDIPFTQIVYNFASL